MTTNEIKTLNNIIIKEENNTYLHLHTAEGYTLYCITMFDNYKFNEETNEDDFYTDYQTEGCKCVFFPIGEIDKYDTMKDTEYQEFKEKFDNSTIEEKEIIFKNFNNFQ